MALIHTPICDFGSPAIDFSLSDPDGTIHTLNTIKGEKGTLVMFICNHCPYVKAIQQKLSTTTRQLLSESIGVVAIMSNDFTNYPDDAPDKMKQIHKSLGYPFPYLIDEDQSIAKACGALCTPDFFGYNKDLKLQYRGRFDSAKADPTIQNPVPELLNAMKKIAETDNGPSEQNASMGCSIKWK